MPKLGMEPIRRAALIDATIAEIGAAGTLDITVGQIARRAGVSSGLAHHYFGGKDDMLMAAMRHVMREYAREVRLGLAVAQTPRARLEAIDRGRYAASNFTPDTIGSWLNLYVLALSSGPASRMQRIYAKRLRSNLCHALRPLVGTRADNLAAQTAALIDGLSLHQGLSPTVPDGDTAIRQVMSHLDRELKG